MLFNLKNLLSLIVLLYVKQIVPLNVINFALFWPEGSPEIEDSINFTDIVQYGVDYVNNNNNILSNYTLRWKFFNSGCTVRGGARAYIEMLEDAQYMFIIGPACTVAADTVAQDITSENILMLSYLVTSPTFSDNRVYPNFFRVFPSDAVIVNAINNFIIKLEWKRVGLIIQAEDLFTASSQLLSSLLEKQKITTQNFLFYNNESIPSIVEEVIRLRLKIIVGLFYAQEGLQILCEFYKNRDRTGKIIWLLPGWLPREFWNTTQSQCTSDSFLDQLEYSIGFEDFPTSDHPNNKTFLQITANEFVNIFIDRSNIEVYLFDAFQAMVNALNVYQNDYFDLCVNNSKYCLRNYHNHESRELIQLLRNILYTKSFLGVSGLVNFSNNGDRILSNNVNIIQWRSGDRLTIGNSSSQSSHIVLNTINWPDGPDVVPSDGTGSKLSFISSPQFVVFTLLAAIGIILCFCYIITILVFHNHAVIRAYSPILTTLFLIGSALLLVWVIIFQVPILQNFEDTAFSIICNFSSWLGTIGSTLMFMPIFLKTVKAFYFKEYHLKNPTKRHNFNLKEWHLVLCLIIFIIIDVLYLTIWTAFHNLRLTKQLMTTVNTENNVLIEYREFYCGTEDPINRKIMFGILICYKALFVLLAMVIVIDTRAVKYVVHKEITWIGIAVYALAILGSIAIACYKLIMESVAIRYGIVSITVIIIVMLIVHLQFLPLLILVIQDPSSKKTYDVDGIEKSNQEDLNQQLAKVSILTDENFQLKEEIREHSDRLPCSPNLVNSTECCIYDFDVDKINNDRSTELNYIAYNMNAT